MIPTPHKPAAIEQDKVTDEINEREKDVGHDKQAGFGCEILHTCGTLWIMDSEGQLYSLIGMTIAE